MLRIALVPAALLLALPAAALVPQKGSRAPAVDYAEMRKDLETMRRILEQEMFDRASAQAYNLLVYAHGAAGGGGAGSDAYYVAGDGALFVLKTSSSLAPAEKQSEDTPTEEPSRWDSVRADVEGRSYRGAVRVHRRAAAEYDAASVEALKDRLLKALSTYSAKIGQLADSDAITVIVRGGGVGRFGSGSILQRVRPGVAADPDAKDIAAAELDVWSGGVGGGESVLTIRVSRADAAAAAAGSLEFGAFKSRARISQY